MIKKVPLTEIIEIVDKFKATGLSVTKYCKKTDYNINRLRWYIKKIQKIEKTKEQKQPPAFTKIPILINTVKSNIKIKFREFEIEIQDNVNQGTLQKVISAFEKVMFNLPVRNIYLANELVDMRKSFDTLAEFVKFNMEKDPLSGDAFVFIGKRRNRLKVLFWEDSGYWLCNKKLEQGTFSKNIIKSTGI
jgi:hypothetical protein